MAEIVFVIAQTVQDAEFWARTQRLGRGEWKLVRDANDLQGRLGGRLVILAGAQRRHDFDYLGSVARSRGMTFQWIDERRPDRTVSAPG